MTFDRVEADQRARMREELQQLVRERDIPFGEIRITKALRSTRRYSR